MGLPSIQYQKTLAFVKRSNRTGNKCHMGKQMGPRQMIMILIGVLQALRSKVLVVLVKQSVTVSAVSLSAGPNSRNCRLEFLSEERLLEKTGKHL
jgi:hypothetical protein